MTSNGQVAVATDALRTAAEHIAEGEAWLHDAESFYSRSLPTGGEVCARVAVMQKFAELHFLAATAADVAREADAEDRIASCVPVGGSTLGVTVSGR